MNLQQANFEDLYRTYYLSTSAQKAAEELYELITNQQSQLLATLLRDYRKKAIILRREIKFREATDSLMDCCSAMEIASLIGFIPKLRDTDFGNKMLCILENRYVRLYYEKFYPTKLPQLFRYRLAGETHTIKQDKSTDIYSIIEFLSLDLRFRERLNNGYLLRMLDSFTIEGFRFTDVVDLINRPKKFIQLLLVAPEKRDVLSQTLNEFSLFMQFCFDLQHLLTQTVSNPLLQSAIWNHYSYWFNIIGEELNDQLDDALSRFLAWEPEKSDNNAVETVQNYVLKARSVLSELTSTKFTKPIDNLLREISLNINKYEIIFILQPDLCEHDINAVASNARKVISAYNGEFLKMEDWGIRKLAFPINEFVKGRYCYLRFNGEMELIKELERCLKFDEKILRYQAVKLGIPGKNIAPAIRFEEIDATENIEISENILEAAEE